MFAVVLAITLWFVLAHSYPSHVTINEVSASGEQGDWIELYNPSLTSLSLKGYYLTDSNKNLTKFTFTDDFIVPSHGYLVVYAQNYTSTASENVIQLPFNIKNGETIYLVDKDGATILDRFTIIESNTKGGSVGRFPDGTQEFFTFTTGTPGTQNDKDESRVPMRR